MNLTQEKVSELIRACAEGDKIALKEFFEIYSQDIYNFPLKVFHMSEDDASDFFLYAFERLRSGKRLQSFKGKSSFRTWFYTVLRNMLIDWKRNKKEVKIISANKVNSNGVEYSTIENEPDTLSEQKVNALSFADKFYEALADIKIENRITFKLAYIYYLNFREDEIQYILQKTGMNLGDFQKQILDLRERLSQKEEQSIKNEDKLTMLYLNIIELKQNLEKDAEHEFKDNLGNSNRIQDTLDKKYEQRRKLLEKREKGLFLTRTPYKVISSFLKIPEGSVSIALQRVIEKIKKSMES
ncbi:MAG: RNA polymerase sigma factor [Spirochaetota bacterium]